MFKVDIKSKTGENLHIGKHVLEIGDHCTFNWFLFLIIIITFPNVKSKCLSHSTKWSLFDCYIGGGIKYASEICVKNKSWNVEILHLDICKQMLSEKGIYLQFCF